MVNIPDQLSKLNPVFDKKDSNESLGKLKESVQCPFKQSIKKRNKQTKWIKILKELFSNKSKEQRRTIFHMVKSSIEFYQTLAQFFIRISSFIQTERIKCIEYVKSHPQ